MTTSSPAPLDHTAAGSTTAPPAEDAVPAPSGPAQANVNVNVEEAIQRVLNAELQARTAVQNCRTRARRETLRARSRSRRILQRGERRLALVRRRARDSVERRLAELQQEAAGYATPPELDRDELARAHEAARILAARLTGAAGDEHEQGAEAGADERV